MQKVIITGLNGFLGRHFYKYLKNNIENIEIFDSVFDITKEYLVNNIVRNYKPDYFFNFAAISDPKSSFSINDFYNINSLPIYYQLNSIIQNSPQCIYVNAGSILEYTNENFYALSKRLSRCYVDYFRNNYKINARQFFFGNFTSKDQSLEYFLPKIINYAVRLNNDNNIPPLYLGNILNYRSFLHVEDVCNIIWNQTNNSNKDSYIFSPDFYSLKNIIQKVFNVLEIDNRWIDDNNTQTLKLLINNKNYSIISQNINKVSKNYFTPLQNYCDIKNSELKYDSIDKIIKSFIV